MMNSNIDLQNKLEAVLGSSNVYFQPPASLKLSYPCIVYHLTNIREKQADNVKYKRDYMYRVTLIHQDPDNDIVDKILDMPYTRFENSYTTQGLNHYVFAIYNKNEKEIK